MTKRRSRTQQTVLVQQEVKPQVVEVDGDGSIGRTLGSAVLVSSDVAVMRLDDRASMPALPLRVLVPAAAGGGRDEHHTRQVEVAKVHEAADGSAHAVLILASPVPPGRVVGRPSPRAGSDGSVAQNGEGWWCKIWPPACR